MKDKPPYMNSPCAKCPFRKDSMEGWLGGDRMAEILAQTSFVCHKTTNKMLYDRRQCAGHMIIKGEENAFVAAAKDHRVKLDLRGQSLIFESEKECIEHHE